MTGRKPKNHRRTAPVLENLEDRMLLDAKVIAPDGNPINDKDLAHYQLQKANNVPVSDRRISYVTPQGTKVQLTLYGFGSLKGTTVRPDGILDLVYDDTQADSKIVGHIAGGNGRARLGSIRDADLTLGSPSAAGSNPINVVNLKKFDLVQNGYVNLSGGVGTLALRSAARNTQIIVTALPEPTSTTTTPTAVDVVVDNFVPGTNTANTTTGQQVTLIPTSTTATTEEPEPTGVEISIPKVNAAPRSVALGNAQVFGFDPTTNTIVRFDGVTGAALQSIPVAAGGTPLAGVGLGRNNGRLVALVGSGSTITAYDAISGAAVGQFSTASLAANGLTEIDAIGSSDFRTFVADSKAAADGLIQRIDVTQSLATGQAVAVGVPYQPGREFELTGGLTGLAGASTIFAVGAAHFDTFVPNRVQVGVLDFNTNAGVIRETARTGIRNPLTGTFIDAGIPGQPSENPVAALGSIGPNLALVTGVANGKNLVTLYNPSTIAAAGALTLDNPNRLAGLSESFHPELFDAAIINVRGNLKRFIGQNATGLVVNSTGAVNLIALNRARDSAFIGAPLNHIQINRRQNVTAISTARGPKGTGTRGGVTISTAVPRIGILTLP